MSYVMKALAALNVAVYRASGGRLMGRMGRAPILLLTTTGRKTGRRRTTPLLYLTEGDALVLVASAGGRPEHPAWYRNLEASPVVEVQIAGTARTLRASTATAEERARLWPKVVSLYPGYGRYQRKTAREIPLVVLRSA